MKCKFFTALFLLLAWGWAFGQVPIEIPAEYGAEYQRKAQDVERQRAVHGDSIIFLDPIEQVPIAPSIASLQGGNYSSDFFGIDAAMKAWVRANKLRSVVVFVLDTAGETSHPALAPFLWPEKNRVFTGEPPFDAHGHGTHVAGCIAGAHPDGLPMGPASILEGNLRIVFHKVLSNGGSGSISGIVAGIDAVTAQAADLIKAGWMPVINLSLGGSGQNAAMDAACKRAEDAGVLVIAAAGNSGQRGVSTPANGPSAHAIAAVDRNNARASFSTFGPELYMSAPGVRVFSAWKSGGYAELSGTSMASPSHTAMAALVLATSDATARQVSRFMAARGTLAGAWNERTGWGFLPAKAVRDGGAGTFPDTGNGNPGGDDGGGGDPPPPPPPPPDSPHGLRPFSLQGVGPYTVLWKAGQGAGDFTRTPIVLGLSWEAKGRAGDVTGAVAQFTDKFFTNRAFVLLPGDDELEAAFWVRHFYEMIAKREGLPVTADIAYVDAATGKLVEERRPRRRLASRIKQAWHGRALMLQAIE